MPIYLPNQFDPRPYQLRPMRFMTDHGSDGRRKRAVWVVHRRGGKDLTWLHIMCMLMLRRVGMYWLTYPTFEQARKAIWEGFRSDGKRIIDNVFPPELVRRRDNQQMTLELRNGSIFRIIGTDKIETVGAGPVGVVHSEYSIARPKARELISPMLMENDGWEACIYTPRGANHGKKLYDIAQREAALHPERWFCELLTLFDTRAYDPEQTLAEERAAGKPEEYIRQEYLCDWTAANVGAVWGELIEALEKAGAVAEFTFDRKRVFTTWDLGGSGARGDATAVWIWAPTPDGVDLLDYYEGQGKVLTHYVDEVNARCEALEARPVKHWLPHDARAKHLTGVSVYEQLAETWGFDQVAIYPEVGLLDGIQAVRWLLQKAVRIHPRCNEGLEAIKAYHYEWDEDRKTFANHPEHDWSSHGSDAFRGLALVVRHTEKLTRPQEPPKPKPYTRPVDRSVTLDELWEDLDRENT